ncbi:MAG TPA: phosphoribosylamine--glycine ligase [Gemmatimonadaceae bacterium]|nr:phosphoribosylamine--glycine ligase [Gemmatimonadaceae bacterium]
MRILIVGGGGREHALAWRLRRDDPSLELIAAPGNPGLAGLGECVPQSAGDVPGLEALARDRAVDLTVVGPEAPLAAGIVDRFQAAGLPIFGPTRAAAEIETSKAFAKQLMLDAGIPTARAEVCTRTADAKRAARRFGAPVVIKASGLAAGKGVIVCHTLADADQAIDDMLKLNRFGPAGAEVLVEEFMEGEELSVFAITNGTDFVMLPALQDHKRLADGDRGPNTGGMGAYLPVSVRADDGGASDDVGNILRMTLDALRARGRPFTGLLYAGLMLTREGPKVVEFNCRFGDPETQALMPALDVEPGLLELMLLVARSRPLPPARARARGACVTTVLAAANYPDTPRTGDAITLPAEQDDVTVFHAGTSRDADGRLVTSGGRVLAVTAVADTMEAAQRTSLDFAERVLFAGKQHRTDIGWREIARQREHLARASRD